MIQPLRKYQNITTGQTVEVEKVYESGLMQQLVVAYLKIPSFEGFVKPLYVFERTYKPVKRVDL